MRLGVDDPLFSVVYPLFSQEMSWFLLLFSRMIEVALHQSTYLGVLRVDIALLSTYTQVLMPLKFTGPLLLFWPRWGLHTDSRFSRDYVCIHLIVV
jgi:hypothetical protein